MQYRRLGASGLQLSALSFGAWMTFGRQVGRGQARELIAAAWDHGINFFDNAEAYANGEAERVMGDVIADLRLPRDGFCVSSKVFFGAVEDPRPTQRGLSRKHVVEACHAALRRLRVEHLDLYYCHRPDPDTPVEETVAAMDLLVRQGKVLYWGTSEWPEALIRDAALFPTTAPFLPRSPYEVPPRPGDLLCADRSRDPIRDWRARIADRGRFRPMHCDIVVGIGPGHADAIGGNVLDAVTRTRFPTDAYGYLLPELPGAPAWFAVFENRLGRLPPWLPPWRETNP